MKCSSSALVLVLMGLLACADSGPTAPGFPATPAFAKGGGVAPPKVDEAIPNEAPQGTSLTVRVKGSGFDQGSAVRFLLSGQATPGMTVTETRWVSGTDLDVDLTIAADADVALYDIEVMTARGKKGIGTEKFSVKLNGPPPEDILVTATFRDDPTDGVSSDGLLPGGYDAVINQIGNLFLDARVDIPRKLCMAFAGQPGAPADMCDDGYFSTAEPDISAGLRTMTVGATMTTRAQVTWVKLGYNWALRFGMDCSLDDDVGRLVVQHPNENTWILEGSAARLCGLPTKGRPRVEDFGTFTMPFELTLVRQ